MAHYVLYRSMRTFYHPENSFSHFRLLLSPLNFPFQLKTLPPPQNPSFNIITLFTSTNLFFPPVLYSFPLRPIFGNRKSRGAPHFESNSQRDGLLTPPPKHTHSSLKSNSRRDSNKNQTKTAAKTSQNERREKPPKKKTKVSKKKKMKSQWSEEVPGKQRNSHPVVLFFPPPLPNTLWTPFQGPFV